MSRWLVRGAWVLEAATALWLVAFSGTDPASTIVFLVALLALAVAVLCAGRAIGARGIRGKSLWIGRVLALLGAAFTISFPGQLYQEILMLQSRGQTPAAWFPGAIWFSAATIPLFVAPALVALRWPRAGGALFVLLALFNAAESVYHPFGVIFPEATTDLVTLVLFIFLPPFATGALLLIGGTGRRPPPIP